MEPWRLITTWSALPAFNMGLDGALLENADAAPTMRFYGWSPDALSLGYFQKIEDVPGTDGASVVVRRITGGGAIHHVNELTFSIAASEEHPLFRGPVPASYARVHAVISAALEEFGVTARLRGDAALESDRSGTGMCFHQSTPLDLAWNGRKGVGSAQRRKGGRVLHHGSIKIGASPLEKGVATVEPGTSGVTPEVLAQALRKQFETTLGMQFTAGVPERAELDRADELGALYLSEAFLRRR